MKNTQIFVLFFIGIVLTSWGAWLKFDRHPDAGLPLIIGLTFGGFAIVLLILKMRKGNDGNSFLDS